MPRKTVASLDAEVAELKAQIAELQAQMDTLKDALLTKLEASLEAKVQRDSTESPFFDIIRKKATNGGHSWNARLIAGVDRPNQQQLEAEFGRPIGHVTWHTDRAGNTWTNIYPS